MKKNLFIIVILSILICLTACENIFSASLAAWARRSDYGDLSNLSYSDASQLLEQALANNNKTLAQSLVPVFKNFVRNTDHAATDYAQKGRQLFEALFLASNLTTAYNTLFSGFISGEEMDAETLAEQFQGLIVWNDTYSDAMMLCLDPDLFNALDTNALALAAFALALDVGQDLNLDILNPSSIDEQDEIELLKDSAQFQVVLTIIDLLSGVDPEANPLVGAFSQLFDGISNLMGP